MKQKLRKHYRSIRKKLSPEERTAKSKQIIDKLNCLDAFKNAKSILLYLSSPEEVETHFLAKECIQNPNIKVFAPRMDGEHLSIHEIDSWEDLELHEYFILEPKIQTKKAEKNEYDLILVPGVSFDNAGNRLGMGKGYYDRLLKKLKGPKIGLGFEEQISKQIPTEDHDQKMDFIITDQQIISPNPSPYGSA